MEKQNRETKKEKLTDNFDLCHNRFGSRFYKGKPTSINFDEDRTIEEIYMPNIPNKIYEDP